MLEFLNISHKYDKKIILNDLSLKLEVGEIVSLLGANGAGKSTTLKAISGLLKTEDGEITRGNIFFEGKNITKLNPSLIVKDGIFQVMEGRRCISDMTVEENLRLGAHTRKDRKNITKDIDKVLDFFPRLRERKGLSGYLSGGEQQMLAIGRALMAKPKIILMDEPSMGLSPLLVKEVFDIIKKLNKELGITILLVEQNAKLALGLSQRAYIMENGKIVLEGSSEELINNEDVKEFYLGGGNEKRKSFKDLKSYKRRKRWL